MYCFPWAWGGWLCLRRIRKSREIKCTNVTRENLGKVNIYHELQTRVRLIQFIWLNIRTEPHYPSLLLSLSDRGGEKTADTGAALRLADSSIRLSMKLLTWLSNWRIRSFFRHCPNKTQKYSNYNSVLQFYFHLLYNNYSVYSMQTTEIYK